MKLAKGFVLLALGIVALVGIAACQQSADTNPTSPDPFQSVAADVRGNGYGIGGIKVDSNCDLCDSDYEDNTIAPGLSARVWIKNGPGDWCSTYYYEIADKGVVFTGDDLDLGYQTCDDLRGYLFNAPGASAYGGSHSVTLTVYCGDTDQSVGSDSFRLVNNGNCEK